MRLKRLELYSHVFMGDTAFALYRENIAQLYDDHSYFLTFTNKHMPFAFSTNDRLCQIGKIL